MRKSISLFVGAALSLVLLIYLRAQKVDAVSLPDEKVAAKLAGILPQPLPEISTVIPGYVRPDREAPTLVAGNLAPEATNEITWGFALGAMLRWNMMYCPTNRIRMPDLQPDNFRYDLDSDSVEDGDVTYTIDSLKLGHDRWGIENALGGTIFLNDATYSLRLSLVSLPAATTILPLDFEGPLEELPRSLIDVVVKTHSTLGVPLDASSIDFLEHRAPRDFDRLKELVRFFNDTWSKKNDENWNDLFARKADAGALHPYAIFDWTYHNWDLYEKDYQRYLDRLQSLKSRWPEDRGVAFYVARSMNVGTDPDRLQKDLEALTAAVLENPYDPMPLILVGSRLNDAGRTEESLTVYSEVVNRWPRVYRGWWGLALASYRHAWVVRGQCRFWNEVSDQGKEVFPDLIAFCVAAADRGLELRGDSADLWGVKMDAYGSLNGRCDEFFRCFEKAVEYGPSCRWIYDDAINYTRRQWGGSYDDQNRIVQAAIKNNPNEIWPYATLVYEGDLRIDQWEKDAFDPKEALALAKKLVPAASKCTSEKEIWDYYDWSCLKSFLRSGAYQEGSRLLEKILTQVSQDSSHNEVWRMDRTFVCALWAIAFEDGDLAEKCLNGYRRVGELPNFNLRFPVVAAMVDIVQGSPETAQKKLKEIIDTEPGNLFARNRYMEIGVNRKLDRETLDRSFATLVTEADIDGPSGIPKNEYKSKESKDPPLYILGQLFENLALAHRAAEKGQSSEAIELYRRALYWQREDEEYVDWREPLVLAPMYREIRKTYGE